MSWKKLLESVSESLNDHIQLRTDDLIAENRILRHQIDGWVELPIGRYAMARFIVDNGLANGLGVIATRPHE